MQHKINILINRHTLIYEHCVSDTGTVINNIYCGIEKGCVIMKLVYNADMCTVRKTTDNLI